MWPEVQSNDVHSLQWFEIRLLWDHHSCKYQIFTDGSAKNNFMLFWTLWMLSFAKLVQCIISLSLKSLKISLYFYILLYYSTGMNFVLQHPSQLFSGVPQKHRPHRPSHDHTCPLPLPITKPTADIGRCPSECAKLHLLEMRDCKSHSWCWQSSCRNHRLFCMVLLCSQISVFYFASSISTSFLVSFCKFKTVLLLAFSSGSDQTDRLKKQRLLNPLCWDMEWDHLFSDSHKRMDCSGHGLGVLIPVKGSAGL